MALLADFLVLAGSLLLLLALVPLGYMRRRLPPGANRMAWMFLSGLILLFFAGYLGYAVLAWNRAEHWADLVVPAVFFFGAVFVLVVCWLSAKTADDVMRLCHLEHEIITDPLMGIYNRRHLDRCLRQEATKSRRYGLPLSAMLIDVDHFKKVNDTYGHAVGDRVLQALAQTIKGSVRDFDLVFRYGGEELVVLLPYTEGQGAMVLAERLCHWLADRCLVGRDEQLGCPDLRVTISIGVATFVPAQEEEGQLMARADAALYQAKQAGRNRVIYAAPPVAAPPVAVPPVAVPPLVAQQPAAEADATD